ncbi:Glucose-1-phosphate cytidylyltransferase [Usitatibacter rugosus]|uniref:Glucose-1-phosphate cytidylyltransferase n=1 Tax=Usitatibacter rugosus TaxID=2732067 RepID=A0A6M4H1V4_9PROT|nr:glucose-1-phosphate cytidylyltransferase [Usitatibacter rugosus]QJR12683.1 Glucose-1-phosphate cytidylyltransferase [Usitatibacter rugosus]
MSPAGMEAVILCGGQGTRLREETEFKPKPMVEIGGKPILWHILRRYHRFGVRRFVLCLGYKGEVIRDYFLNYRVRQSDVTVNLRSHAITVHDAAAEEDWEIVLTDTGDDTMTGGRIKRALKHVQGSRFFATYGDGVADIDIAALLASHEKGGRLATVTAVHPSSRYGEIDVAHGAVKTFSEKPQVNDGWINGGFFVFDKKAFDGVSDDPGLVLETDVLPPLAARGQLSAFQHGGFWQCMDTYREMLALNQIWARGNAPWL